MEGHPPLAPAAVDLLVVGGLTVDLFPDGLRTAGGSVVHAATAGAAAGLRMGIVTAAGDEPEARAGLAALGRLALVHAERTASSILFRHESGPTGRRLVLIHPGEALACPTRAFSPSAILYAPVAGEFGANLAGQTHEGATTGAILQGWLRPVDASGRVGRGPLTILEPALVRRLAELDLLCLSLEDVALAGAVGPATPDTVVEALRSLIGERPVLAVTAGARGAWIDHAGERRLVPPPRVVSPPDGSDPRAEGAATVGAGDAYAAILLAALASGEPPGESARLAAGEVVRFLRRRQGQPTDR